MKLLYLCTNYATS